MYKDVQHSTDKHCLENKQISRKQGMKFICSVFLHSIESFMLLVDIQFKNVLPSSPENQQATSHGEGKQNLKPKNAHAFAFLR